MPNDVYVKLQTVSENIVSLTIYESAEEIEKAVKSARYKEDQWIGGIFDALVSLRGIPAADVEPVRHGRWVWGYDMITRKHEYICDQCGYAPYYGGSIYNYKYCPNCGAMMDKEEDSGNEL